MAAGRPSLYKSEYCEQIVEFCRKGYSITGFAGEIGVCRDTITAWAQEHAEFSAAVKKAKAAAARCYEGDGHKIRQEGGGNATLVIFGLKNMAPDDYADKVVNEHTGKDGGAIQITDETRVRALAAFLAKTKAKG